MLLIKIDIQSDENVGDLVIFSVSITNRFKEENSDKIIRNFLCSN